MSALHWARLWRPQPGRALALLTALLPAHTLCDRLSGVDGPKAASRQLVASLPKALALSQIPSDDMLPLTVDVVVTDTQTGALALLLHRPTVGGRVSAAREDHMRATVAHRQRHVQVPT